MTDPPLPDVVTLHVLFEERHVTRAAKRLGITQSSMSHRLARLRQELGDPLFVRRGSELVLTARSVELQASLGANLANLRALVAPKVRFEPRSARLRLELHLPDLMMHLVPSLVATLAEQAPGVSLCIGSVPPDLSKTLACEAPSLALVPSHFLDEGLHSRRIGDVKLAIVGREGHPLFNRKVTTERWLGYPHVVVRTGNERSNPVEKALKDRGLERSVGLEVPSFVSGLLALRDSGLLLTAPTGFDPLLFASLALRSAPLPLVVPRVPMSLAWHARFQADAAHKFVRGLVHTCASASLANRGGA